MAEAEEGSPEAILIAFYAKHEPDFANLDKVSKITSSFQKKAKKKGGDWEEMMFAAMKKQRGEDPRALYQEIMAAKANGSEPAGAPLAAPATAATASRRRVPPTRRTISTSA